MSAPKTQPVYMTRGFVQNVHDQIVKAMEGQWGAFDAEIPLGRKRYTLEQILGPEERGYWWRLYIDPKDWDDASKLYPKNPGSLYDKQTSPGWQEDLTAVYKRFLKAKPEHNLSESSMTWDKYQVIWDVATAKAKANVLTKDAFVSRFDEPKTGGSYSASVALAQDAIDEKINYKYLVKDGNDDTRWPDGSEPKAFLFHWEDNKDSAPGIYGKTRVEPIADGEILKNAVNTVFTDFHEWMLKAKTRGDQLKIIAKTIRLLHMLHTWTDGCGRVNVQTLLPAMLMEYGFGLPLGGRYGQGIDKQAQFQMFNGGFSVPQMAWYLWVMQDFGLEQPEHSVLFLTPSTEHTGTLPLPTTTQTPTTQEVHSTKTVDPSEKKT